MTALAQTALDFCREVLGWEGATLSMWGQCSNKMVVAKRGRSVVKRLRFTDLDAVMEAVRGWCDRSEAAVEIGYHGYIPGEWEVLAITSVSVETIQASDLIHALLSACVEASRKLKGAA